MTEAAETIECEQVIGLDNSGHFLSLAQDAATNKVTFVMHDITNAPFPYGPFDLIYARFLLTHQRHPEKLIAKWATQLRRKSPVTTRQG